MSRIGQRTKDVKDRSDSHLFPNDIDALHHIVIVPRIKVAKAQIFQHRKAAFGTEEDISTQSFEEIRRPAARRLRPIAVFCDANTAGSNDKSGRR